MAVRFDSLPHSISCCGSISTFRAATRSDSIVRVQVSEIGLQPQTHYLLPFVYVDLPYLHSRPAKAVPIYVPIFSCSFTVVLAAYQMLHLVLLRAFSDIPIVAFVFSFCSGIFWAAMRMVSDVLRWAFSFHGLYYRGSGKAISVH